jgi:hypothetical protein
MANAKRDANRVPTLIGVSSADGKTPRLVEIDPNTGEVLVKASVTVSSDIEIGAVEIKDGGSDTRATVGANGLEVEVKALPDGLATAAKQLPDGHQVEVNNLPDDYPLPDAQVETLTPPPAITGFATEDNQTNGDQVSKIQEVIPTDSTKVNSSLALSNDDEVEASTKTLTKTIDGTDYTKTLSYNAAGDLIGVSVWTEI